MRNNHWKLKRKAYKRDAYTCQLKLVPHCAGDMSLLWQKYLDGKITRRRALITIDHTTPLSKGGKWEIGNIRVACTFCNRFKGNEEPDMDDVEIR